MVPGAQIVGCPVCGKQYEVYSLYCGDQTLCPKCRRARDEAVKAPDTKEQERKRREVFG